jgi:hypothetical protein
VNRRYAAQLCVGLSVLGLAACSTPSPDEALRPREEAFTAPPAWSGDTAYSESEAPGPANPVAPEIANPRIVRGASRLQCVPYARQESGIAIRGNAWTWWNQARGKYSRSNRPTVGSVLVVGRTASNRYGHLAVVTRVVSEREIIVNHANWLNKGRIHLDTPVRDVSPANDWSAVRFWYTPGNVLGRRVYPVSGFIQPTPVVASSS